MGSEYAYAAYNLIIVLVVMFALFFLLKKFRTAKYSKQKFINVIQVVPLGTKEKIILIEAHHSLILLGATSTHIETLHVFDHVESEDMVASINKDEKTFSLNPLGKEV